MQESERKSDTGRFHLGQRFAILEVLEDKELTWRFILGSNPKYYKGELPKSNSQTIDEIQEEAKLSKEERERKEKLAKLKRSIGRLKEYKPELDLDKVGEFLKTNEIGLKVAIDFWHKNHYDIYGLVKLDGYVLCLEKNFADIKEAIIYNAETELLYATFEKNGKVEEKLLGVREIYMLSKLIELTNPEVIDFCNK